jgi:hypothetical protein
LAFKEEAIKIADYPCLMKGIDRWAISLKSFWWFSYSAHFNLLHLGSAGDEHKAIRVG